MTINDQIRDEKLRYDINREAAVISAKSSGKFHKYEYLTDEDILSSNQQQLIKQARFTYSLLGKAFQKQIKTIDDQGKTQVDALENLKLKPIEEERKPIEDKPNNQSRAAVMFSDIIKKRKELTSKLYDSVDYSNLNFKYVDPKNNDVSFYEHRDSKQLFSSIKDNKIRFDDAIKKQHEFLNKLSNIRIGNKNQEQKDVINNLERFYISREEVINFFRDHGKMVLDAAYKSKHNKTEGKGLKILTPKQMFQRLPIALAQVKAGNNSESSSNEIRQIIYSLYQSKKIAKNVCNNVIKSIQ